MARHRGGIVSVDPEVLRRQYVIERMSSYELAPLYGVSPKHVRTWLRQFGIPARGPKENKTPVARGGSHSWGAQITEGLLSSSIVGKGNAGKRGPDAPNWKGGKKVAKNGRVSLWDSEAKRYFPRAVVVWREAHGGEQVGSGFVIHHIDGDPENDVPENLIRLSVKEHMMLHRRREREYIEVLQQIILDLGGSFPPMHLID